MLHELPSPTRWIAKLPSVPAAVCTTTTSARASSTRSTASGSFGLASQLSSALGSLTTENSPRFVSRTTLPNLPCTTPAPTQTFPYVLPQTYPASASVLVGALTTKSRLPTPKSSTCPSSALCLEALHSKPHMSVDFGRKLMQQIDLATPVNLLDPKSGTTYFQAGAQLAALVDQNGGSAKRHGSGNSLISKICSLNSPPEAKSATQNIYTKEFATFRKVLGETTALGRPGLLL